MADRFSHLFLSFSQGVVILLAVRPGGILFLKVITIAFFAQKTFSAAVGQLAFF